MTGRPSLIVLLLSVMLAVQSGGTPAGAEEEFSENDRRFRDDCYRYLVELAKFEDVKAIKALGEIGGKEAIDVLKSKCKSANLGEKVTAATSLWKLGEEEGLNVLLEVLESAHISNIAERQRAVEGIAVGERAAAVKSLWKLIREEPDKQIKVYLIREFCLLAGPAEVPRLTELLDDRWGRMNAIETLEGIKIDEEDLKLLFPHRKNASPRIRFGVFGILAASGRTDDRASIVVGMRSEDIEERLPDFRGSGTQAA